MATVVVICTTMRVSHVIIHDLVKATIGLVVPSSLVAIYDQFIKIGT